MVFQSNKMYEIEGKDKWLGVSAAKDSSDE